MNVIINVRKIENEKQQKSIELKKCESMVHRSEKKRLHCDRRQAWMEPFQCFVLKKTPL